MQATGQRTSNAFSPWTPGGAIVRLSVNRLTKSLRFESARLGMNVATFGRKLLALEKIDEDFS